MAPRLRRGPLRTRLASFGILCLVATHFIYIGSACLEQIISHWWLYGNQIEEPKTTPTQMGSGSNRMRSGNGQAIKNPSAPSESQQIAANRKRHSILYHTRQLHTCYVGWV
ncbi:hypothetical protein P152DRAFT_73793 [Eremomyces bilateralis CBS 781.70]|uniref:Uncharacterized protein n=1 Tax=Eremomyces bilateralis CBS 781.70 TaxID=1392243 RepID=A0A6G1FYT5_9PEZI|nr:uncharacterized protein P152DRAFT_73793 [Eremomyces bilateralis CBS 781.70]KAF1811007.1 hypothetical protein P152DRAFT_73793 [Eremomyces bilateralis CBS 781.70]